MTPVPLSDFFPLTGRRAIVTGASSGLGAHFAMLLARCGCEVVAVARREEALAQLVEKIRHCGGVADAVSVDVTSSEAISILEGPLGGADILINNAGIVRTAPALDQTEEDWDAVIDTNLKAMFRIAQAAARAMRQRGGGSIVNVASILGLRQAGGVLPYAVSKAGVIQMTKSLALEVARYKVRVNALAPGYLDTELNRDFWESDAGKALINRIPQRRLGALSQLDGPMLLLASDASSFMTGAVLVVDGGHLTSTL